MTIEFKGNYYFIYLAAFLIITILFGVIFMKKDKNIQYKVLLGLSFFNFALHFLKLLLPEYSDDMPNSITTVTFENIAAVSTIIMPFVLLSKNKVLRDYMFYIGVIGGLLALAYPMKVFGKEATDLDVIRFYMCHSLLFIVPFYMVFFGIHDLNIKRVPLFPLVFIGVLCLILANEVILMEIGLVEFRSNSFLNYNYRNTSFIFGPIEEFEEFSESFIEPLVPSVFKTVADGTYTGSEKYIPILWLAVPCFIYFSVIGAGFCLFFTKVLKKSGDSSSF